MWAGMAKSAGHAPLAQPNPSSLRTKAPQRASFAATCSGHSSPPSLSRADSGARQDLFRNGRLKADSVHQNLRLLGQGRIVDLDAAFAHVQPEIGKS